MTRKIPIAAVMSLGILLGACGEAAQPITQAQFLKRAETICTRAGKHRAAAVEQAGKEVGRSITPPYEQNEIELAARVFLPPLRELVSGLGDLPVPDDGGRLEAMIREYENSLARAEASHEKLLDPRTFAPARDLARMAGLEICTQF
jgi:hypothetical protein